MQLSYDTIDVQLNFVEGTRKDFCFLLIQSSSNNVYHNYNYNITLFLQSNSIGCTFSYHEKKPFIKSKKSVILKDI